MREIKKQLEEIAEKVCHDYCKYPDEYRERYQDPDIAYEVMLQEQCENCILLKIC